MSRSQYIVLGIGVVAVSSLTVAVWPTQQPPEKGRSSPAAHQDFDEQIQRNAKRMLEEGKRTFRFNTFGSEDFWGGKLRLHEQPRHESTG